MAVEELRVLELEPLDVRDLVRSLPEDSCRVEKQALKAGEFGDLGVASVVAITLSPLAVGALAAWILKSRSRQSLSMVIERVGPDQTVEKVHLVFNSETSRAPEAEVLKQMMAGLKLNPDLLVSGSISGSGSEISQ